MTTNHSHMGDIVSFVMISIDRVNQDISKNLYSRVPFANSEQHVVHIHLCEGAFVL